MGKRSNSFKRGMPQRTRLPANRELCRALGAPKTKPFGIRRPLEESVQEILLEGMDMLSSDGMLREDMELRRTHHVTLLPKKRVESQLVRGIVMGYELKQKLDKKRDEIAEDMPDLVWARLGRASVFRGRHLGLRIYGIEIEEEYADIRQQLGGIGIKGLMKNPPPLHVTLASSDDYIGRFDAEDMICAVNEILPVNKDVALEQIEFYPKNS